MKVFCYVVLIMWFIVIAFFFFTFSFWWFQPYYYLFAWYFLQIVGATSKVIFLFPRSEGMVNIIEIKERKNLDDSFLIFMCLNVVNMKLLFFNLPYHYFFLTYTTNANSLVYYQLIVFNEVCLLYSVHIWKAWQNIWDTKFSCKCK